MTLVEIHEVMMLYGIPPDNPFIESKGYHCWSMDPVDPDNFLQVHMLSGKFTSYIDAKETEIHLKELTKELLTETIEEYLRHLL